MVAVTARPEDGVLVDVHWFDVVLVVKAVL